MAEFKFAIVNFPLEEDRPRAVVPTTWLSCNDNECYYPKQESYNKLEKLTKSESVPDKNWPVHPIVLMKKYGKLSLYT